MQNDQPNSNTNTDSSSSSTAPPSLSRGQKVIQPSPSAVEEIQAQRQQEATRQPAQAHVRQNEQVAQARPAYGLGSPAYASKVYPDPDILKAPPSNTAPVADKDNDKSTNTQRVASRVPSVQVYAFVIIIYSIYSLITLAGLLNIIGATKSTTASSVSSSFLLSSPLFLTAFGIAAINILVGVYLLLAKNIKTVAAVLTALLILGGLSLLRSIVSVAQSISHVGASTIVSLFIAVGLFIYLWSVKSDVDVASIE